MVGVNQAGIDLAQVGTRSGQVLEGFGNAMLQQKAQFGLCFPAFPNNIHSTCQTARHAA